MLKCLSELRLLAPARAAASLISRRALVDMPESAEFKESYDESTETEASAQETSTTTTTTTTTTAKASDSSASLSHYQFRDAIHISDPNVANIVAEELRADIAANRCILEVNPGPGVLSKRLLDLGCKRLFLFEPSWSPFLPELTKLQQEHADRVQLVRENLVRMAGILRYDIFNGTNRMQACLKSIPRQDWKAEPTATLVMSLPKPCERRFLLALLYAFSARSMIFSLGRVDILMFLSAEEFTRLVLVKKTTARSAPVLFNLFFDHKFLGSVSRIGFQSNSDSKTKSQASVMNLIRITPRTEIFDRLKDSRRVEEFSFFVRQAFTRGATLMYVNQLIPHAVRDILIQTRWSQKELLNLQPTTKLYTLSPEELLRLFEILSQHDLYPQCPLFTAIDNDFFHKDG